MANPVVISVRTSYARAVAGFHAIQAQARRTASNIQSHFNRMSANIQSRWAAATTAMRRGLTTVGALAGTVGAKLLTMASAAREGAQAAGLMVAKYLALAAVAIHALPSIIDLLGVIQLLPAGLLAGGLAMATFKLATHGMSDAISEALDDFKKWDKSSGAKAMTRWTHDFVAGIVIIRDALKPLRRDLANRLFKELGADLVELKNAHFPAFEKWTKRIATSMNEGARAFGNWLKEPAQIAAVEAIFRNISGAIDSLMGTLKPLGQIFLDIATVGAPRLASISSTFNDLVTKAAAWIDKMKESGKLGEWLDKALDGFTELRGIVADLIGLIGAMYAAADTGGQTFLASLHEQTTALKEWAESAAGQQAIEGLSDLGKVILTLGVAVAQAFIGIIYVVQAIYHAFNSFLGFVLGVLAQILHAAAIAFAWIPGIGPKLQQASKEFDAYRDRVNKSLAGIKDETVYVTIIERKQMGGTLGGSGGFRGFASGGLATGLIKVGERGAELIDVGARTARVHNAGDTRRIESGGSGGGGGVTQVALVSNAPAPSGSFEDALFRAANDALARGRWKLEVVGNRVRPAA